MGGVISLSLLLSTSCEKDLYENSFQKENKNITISKVNFTKIKTNKKVLSKVSESIKKYNKKITNREASYDIFGVVVDTSTIILAETNGLKTYTFKITNNDNIDVIQNLVIEEKSDGTTRGIITDYITSPNTSNLILESFEIVDNDAETGKIVVSGNCVFEHTYSVLMCYDAQGNAISHQGDLGNDCVGTSWSEQYTYIIIDTNCLNSGGGGSGGSDTGTGAGSNSTGGSGGSGSNTGGDGFSYGGDDEIITSPVGLSPKQTRDKCFDKSLPINIQQWLNTNTTINSIVMNYLESTIDDEFQSCYNSEVMNVIKNFLLNANLNWIASQTQQTQQIIFNYLNQNNYSEESDNLVNQWIVHINQNNNSQVLILEFQNIITLLFNGQNNNQNLLLGPNLPITNMASYLSCFNTSQPANITIYADQPVSGQHDLISNNDGVGHAFISIKQGTTIRTFGFYPQSSIGSIIPNYTTPIPGDFYSTSGIFGNDQNHSFDISLSYPISSTQLTNLINGTITYAQSNPQYNLGLNNCTDIALMLFESSTNINIPSCFSPRPLWLGQTPGTLGVVLYNFPTPSGGIKDINGGIAPINFPN